jgi:hypothetical protein
MAIMKATGFIEIDGSGTPSGPLSVATPTTIAPGGLASVLPPQAEV